MGFSDILYKKLYIAAAVILSIFIFVGVSSAADPNLQIDPSQTPRPACFGPWGSSPDTSTNKGDLSHAACDGLYQEYSSADTAFATTRLKSYRRDPCVFVFESKSPAICPPLDSIINFSVDKERPEENGEFTISWSSNKESNYEAQCTLSGKAPEKGNFSESTREGNRTYSFVQRGIYTFQFSCSGVLNNVVSLARGTVTKKVTVFAGDIPPSPIVDLKIDPVSIKKGEVATLSWKADNAISVSINQGIGVVRPSGSIKVSPNNITMYTITAIGEFAELGLARKSVTLKVAVPVITPTKEVLIEVPEEKPVEAPKIIEEPKIDLKVDGADGPLIIKAPASFVLSWNLDKYCLAYGSWIGIKTKSGQERRVETKTGDYLYKLYCPGYGSDEAGVKVVAGAGGIGVAVPLPVAVASISLDGKNFSKSVRVVRGEPAKIWLSAAQGVDIDKKVSRDETGKWTSLLSIGGRCEWNYDLNQGAPTFDAMTRDPQNAAECTIPLGELKFYDKPGVYRYGALRLVQNDGKVSNIGYVNIAVEEPPLPKSPPIIKLRINNIESEQVSLGAPAEYVVSWDVKNADSCRAFGSWEGDKFFSGHQNFVSSIKRELTYSLTCVGKLGTTTKMVNLKVAELPVCDFSALPLVIEKTSVLNRQSALSWKCQFANSCSISPGIDIGGATFGSARVSPMATTKYTLTCNNLEGNSSFEQTVEVK